MKKLIQNKFCFFLIGLILMVSCKPKKVIVAETAIPVNITSTVKVDEILSKDIQYQTFAAKAKTNIDLDGKTYEATLNIRNKKGEIIWASVSIIAGIELGRVMITPDSIKFMNRFSGEYLEKPFSFLQKYVNSAVDYNALEAIFIGNNLPFIVNENANIQQENTVLKISDNANGFYIENFFNELLKTQLIKVQDKFNGQELNVAYSGYSQIDAKYLPINIALSSKIGIKSINLNIEYQSPQFNITQEYPFSVPKRFTRID